MIAIMNRMVRTANKALSRSGKRKRDVLQAVTSVDRGNLFGQNYLLKDIT